MVPKLVAEDIPLLFGLLADIFPGVKYSALAEATLRGCITEVVKKEHLVENKAGVDKMLQLYRIQSIHHGLMLVGPSGSGKSSAMRTLLAAMSKLDGIEACTRDRWAPSHSQQAQCASIMHAREADGASHSHQTYPLQLFSAWRTSSIPRPCPKSISTAPWTRRLGSGPMVCLRTSSARYSAVAGTVPGAGVLYPLCMQRHVRVPAADAQHHTGYRVTDCGQRAQRERQETLDCV